MHPKLKTFLLIFLSLSLLLIGYISQTPKITRAQELKAFYESDAEHIGSWDVQGIGYLKNNKFIFDIYQYGGDYIGVKTDSLGHVEIDALEIAGGVSYSIDGDKLKEHYIVNFDSTLTVAYYYVDEAGNITEEFAAIAAGKPIH